MPDNRLPYFRFYVKDFVSDSKVELMTTVSIGAYVLLLCKAWHEDPPGSVPDSDAVLAKWARLTLDQWIEIKSEVLGAFTLRDNRWHQKRMMHEFEDVKRTSEVRRDAANSRWNKSEDANALQTPCTPAMQSGSVSVSVSVSKKEKGSAEGKGKHFDEFWQLYPKKVGKADAWTAWNKHRAEAFLQKIKDTLSWQVKLEQWTREDHRFVPNPATWLNQERWNDEPTPVRYSPTVEQMLADERKRIRETL